MRPLNEAAPGPLAYNVQGACLALGIGKTTLFAEMKSGRLKAVRAGGRTLIPAESLREWLANLPTRTAA